MLAIFDGRVAKRPECMKLPHKNAVSALKDDFLVSHFTSVYPDSLVLRSEASFTFAYSLGASSTSPLERYRFAHFDELFCFYQGFIKDIEAAKHDISEINDEGIVMIRGLQILRRLGHIIPKKAAENLFENCISVFYEMSSKLVVLAAGTCHNLPIYWGIDARFNLVISSNEKVVEKACGCAQAFISGEIYACCKGRTGKEALFLNNLLPYKLDFKDKYFPISQPIKTLSKMILLADQDRSKPEVQKWEPPPPDFVKINTDAAKFKDGMLGIGIVIRNSKGDVVFAASRKEENIVPGLEELEAFREGFYTAVGLELRQCICESVHLNLDKVKNADKSAMEIVESMVRNSGEEMMKENLGEFSVSFVSSSANKAAHRLALLAKTSDHIFWNKETPDCIAGIIEAERPVIDPAFQELEQTLL